MYKNLNASTLGLASSPSEVIEQALTYGFRGIDLDVVDLMRRAKLRGMVFARRLIDSSKLRVSAFALPFDLETPDNEFERDLAQLAEWAAAAAEVGCRCCLAAIQPAGDRLPYHENFNVYRNRFTQIAKMLQPHDMRLGVGFRASPDLRRDKAFQFIYELEATVLLTSMVGAPNVGIDLDAWDLFVSGGTLDSLRALKPEQIVAVHLADAAEDVALDEMTDRSRLVPGGETGRFDMAAVLATLAEMGYKGPVDIKPDRSSIGATRNETPAKILGRSLDTLWTAVGLTSHGKMAARPQTVS
ncbi:MAG TPA: hypothetical protein DD670_09855 [Planctomycetaceae bacterium]|nr:hypothetical protein [Planctomycetaceae bacterium]